MFIYSVLDLFVFSLCCLRDGISAENDLAGTAKMLLRSVAVPISGGGYWFVTVYAMIMILLPLINPFLHQLSKRGFLLFLLFSWFFWYIIASTGSPFFQLQKGLFFYAMGAYFQLFYTKKDNKPGRLLLVFIVFLIFGGVLAYRSAVLGSLGELGIRGKIVLELDKLIDIGIVVPACAVSLFLCFHSMKIKTEETINALAATTFGVYLLHDSVVGRELIWNTVFKVDTVLYQSHWFPVLAIVVVFAVFFACAAFDYMRILFIEPRMVRTANRILNKIKEYMF